MKKLFIISLLLICLSLTACALAEVRGSGQVVSEDREITNVSGVTLASPGELIITLGDQETLRIEAEDNVLPLIQSEVEDGMLTLEIKKRVHFQPTQTIKYYLTVKELGSIHNTGLGSITALPIRSENFWVQVASGGNVTLDSLETDTLEAALNGLGNLVIGGGQVDTQKVNINSGGSYQAGDLRSQAARVEINSEGEATIWVTRLLDAHLTSSGSLSYYGEPKVTSETTGLGKMIPLGKK